MSRHCGRFDRRCYDHRTAERQDLRIRKLWEVLSAQCYRGRLASIAFALTWLACGSEPQGELRRALALRILDGPGPAARRHVSLTVASKAVRALRAARKKAARTSHKGSCCITRMPYSLDARRPLHSRANSADG